MIISKKQQQLSSLFSTLFISAFIGLILTACDNSSDAPSSRRAAQALHHVEVITVENKAVSHTQTVSGSLEAVTKIRLYNEESARITRLPYHEGDTVKKGTLLVQLDNALLKTDVAKAIANKKQTKLDLSRLKKLLPKKIATAEDVAKAQTQFDLAVAEEERQVTRLRRTKIKAPINGLITKRFYEPGDMLASQSHILSIINPSALRIKASLAERWLPLVKKDQAVTVRIDALGDAPVMAKISRIHPTIDAKTHKGLIEILLDPAPKLAAVGQFSRADITLSATNRLVIPVHTIHYEPEGAYVFRIIKEGNDSHIAEKIFVIQGQQFGEFAEVISGLTKGDLIVSRGQLGLRDNKKVVIDNTTFSPSDATE